MEILIVAVSSLILLTTLFLTAPTPTVWLICGVIFIGIGMISRRLFS